MSVNRFLQQLVAANAPYWGGEAEVIRTYFNSARRTVASDCVWLERQLYKEFWDGFIPPLENKIVRYAELEMSMPRTDLLAAAEILYEELAHYCAFADVYAALVGPQGTVPNPQRLRTSGQWPANVQLMQLRAQHKAAFGDLGMRAHAFTEGGYCTLYSEGMRLRGRGGIDDLIAEACAKVYEDEFDHMLIGIANVGEGLPAAGWSQLTELTVEQMQYRIRMRNAQFGHPVDPAREAELCAGHCAPLEFDFRRAGIALD